MSDIDPPTGAPEQSRSEAAPAPPASPQSRPRRKGRRLFAVAMLAAVIAMLAVGGWFIGGWTAAGPAEADTAVIVPEGASVARAAEALEEAGVIGSARGFLLRARLLAGSGPIQHGEYQVPAGASPSQIMALLQSGRVLQRFVVIPEGTPSVLVHERLMRAPHLTGAVPVPSATK
jgi:UPF0755 protein